MENGETGAGICAPRYQKAIPPGYTSLIFQEEVYAISAYASECSRRQWRRQLICIHFGKRVALKVPKVKTLTSKLALDCFRTLKKLEMNNELHLLWVLGHIGVEGNRRTECLANRRARKTITDSERFRRSYIKRLVPKKSASD